MLDDMHEQELPEGGHQFTRLDLGTPPEAGAETVPDPRQQDKIIAFLARHDSQLFNQHQVEVTGSERHSVMQRLAQAQISPDEVREMLRHINTPAESHTIGQQRGMDRTFNLIALDSQHRGILAEFSREHDEQNDLSGFEQRDSLTAADLEKFFQDYPDPSVLEPQIEPFLAEIAEQNSPAKRLEYEASMRTFLKTVYGKRNEYWEQFKLLQQEALQGPTPSTEDSPAVAEWKKQTTSVGNIQASLQDALDARRPDSPDAPGLSTDGHAVVADLLNSVDKYVQQAREHNLRTATVVQFSDLNIGIADQRADLDTLLKSLGVVVDPGDATGSSRRDPVDITTDMLPYLADGLYWYTDTEASERPSYTVFAPQQNDEPKRAREIRLRTKLPGVRLVLDGPGIDGRSPKGVGGVRPMLEINLDQLK